MKLAHQAAGGTDDEPEIPRPALQVERPRPPAGPPRPAAPRRAPKSPDAVTLFIGAGRQAGVRPADLFGAIAGEAKLPPGAIGAIEITDRFSLVEVPGESAEAVIVALRKAKIRGRKVPVRRERETPGS